ncbi:carbohydrate kinase family protein [Archaeoglobus profundus]|uniref:PfkB domain protein n=1 Tax=Archaeoglobus profundus (strain DSM 5631 / JCM 9629 / NBRC 100127 / Av18) TaxID=572546 RepID=D2RE20_ARCPA|nr:carbohydrate kinase family protein [Archaeoglobus profundus]ADB58364.1 PfkB domain protein [Archaeoglobus profundus DSM 5631]
MFAGVGPALIDYIHTIDQYPPRGGHAVVKSTVKSAGGAGANVIYGLSRYGVKCSFYSTIGKDEDAELFKDSMKGVYLKLSVTHEKTGKVNVYVDRDGERTFFVHPNASGVLKLEMDDEDFKMNDYFYLDPFPSEKSLDVHTDIAKRAKEFGKTVILSMSYPYVIMGFEKLKGILKYIDIAITSKAEFDLLGVDEEDILKFVDIFVITMGKEGAKAIAQDGVYYYPAYDVKVVDTTGAGDAFAVGFFYCYIKGYDLNTCLKIGNLVASYNIQRYGARNFPPLHEVEDHIGHNCKDV